jgi:hypothetical protein
MEGQRKLLGKGLDKSCVGAGFGAQGMIQMRHMQRHLPLPSQLGQGMEQADAIGSATDGNDERVAW